MIVIILYAILMVLPGLVIGCHLYKKTKQYGDRKDSLKLGWLTGTAIAVFLTALTVFLGIQYGNHSLRTDIAAHNAIKMTYEAAVADENLTGLERLEITRLVIGQNAEIAQREVGLRRWWNIHLDRELVAEFEALPFIGVGD